jgi:hypothetical protein
MADLVDTIAARVLQRDTSISSDLATQEAESAIQMYYGDDVDPHTVDDSDVSYRVLGGLTYLTLARVYGFQRASSSGDSVTLGMVSMRSNQSASVVSQKVVDDLIDLAYNDLRLPRSRVMQMADISIFRSCPVEILEP